MGASGLVVCMLGHVCRCLAHGDSGFTASVHHLQAALQLVPETGGLRCLAHSLAHAMCLMATSGVDHTILS